MPEAARKRVIDIEHPPSRGLVNRLGRLLTAAADSSLESRFPNPKYESYEFAVALKAKKEVLLLRDRHRKTRSTISRPTREAPESDSGSVIDSGRVLFHIMVHNKERQEFGFIINGEVCYTRDRLICEVLGDHINLVIKTSGDPVVLTYDDLSPAGYDLLDDVIQFDLLGISGF